MVVKVGLILGLLIVLAVPALAQQPDGAAVFKRACASCHGENQTTAPTPAILRQMTPEAIFNAMTLGRMQIQAISLSEAEQRAVSVFLAGKPFGPVLPPVVVNKCTSTPAMRAPANTGEWNGWGGNVANTRYQKNGGLTAADLPKLKLKWAFGYHSRRLLAAGCSSPARTAKCTRSIRRPGAPTGPSRRSLVYEREWRSAPTRTPAGPGRLCSLATRVRTRTPWTRARDSKSGFARLTSTVRQR